MNYLVQPGRLSRAPYLLARYHGRDSTDAFPAALASGSDRTLDHPRGNQRRLMFQRGPQQGPGVQAPVSFGSLDQCRCRTFQAPPCRSRNAETRTAGPGCHAGSAPWPRQRQPRRECCKRGSRFPARRCRRSPGIAPPWQSDPPGSASRSPSGCRSRRRCPRPHGADAGRQGRAAGSSRCRPRRSCGPVQVRYRPSALHLHGQLVPRPAGCARSPVLSRPDRGRSRTTAQQAGVVAPDNLFAGTATPRAFRINGHGAASAPPPGRRDAC